MSLIIYRAAEESPCVAGLWLTASTVSVYFRAMAQESCTSETASVASALMAPAIYDFAARRPGKCS